MNLRRLSGPDADRLHGARYGRRSGDAPLKSRFYAAAFVAQVAGLSFPREQVARTYAISEPHPPKGIIADRKV